MIADATPSEVAAVEGHWRHVIALQERHDLILAGRSQDEDPESVFGIVIFTAPDEAAAREIFEADPAVASGVMAGTLHPYSVALQA
jgi:uncharacterized protein YciI